MPFKRLCLDCNKITRCGQSRCDTCAAAHRRPNDLRQAAKRRQRLKNGDGSAARLRRIINKNGWAHCGWCGNEFTAAAIEVDHITRLADGGSDYADNVVPLCINCHLIKTNKEKRPSYTEGAGTIRR